LSAEIPRGGRKKRGGRGGGEWRERERKRCRKSLGEESGRSREWRVKEGYAKIERRRRGIILLLPSTSFLFPVLFPKKASKRDPKSN
jgi:hypothetical protein